MAGANQRVSTMADYADQYQWIRQLGWSDEDLRSVPVYEEYSPEDESINLTNFGGTSLGVLRGPDSPTSANVHSVPNLWVVKGSTPARLWDRLQALMEQGGPAGYGPGTTPGFPSTDRGSGR